MTQTSWIGIEVADDAATGWRFDGTAAVQQASGPSAAAVQAQLGEGPALIVAPGAASQPVPAAVLPESAPVCALTQDRPRGHLDPAARLRLIGVLAQRRNWDGVICLPMATVTHWCQISVDEVVSFQSAVTPQLARLLGAGDRIDSDALADTMSRPERLSLHLRSAMLATAGDALSGHLLGAELAAMRPYWLGQQVIVVAEGGLYADALASQGVPVQRIAPRDAAREGLVALRGATL